ncbi:MAG: efflux RND transporter periplasmic adaptor subunit [Candidatus Omnitrophota bacterium]
MKRNIVLIGVIVIGMIVIAGIASNLINRGKVRPEAGIREEAAQIDYYTCGMHPSVRVSPAEYKKGKTNCPICNMKLTPVYKEKKRVTVQRKILFYRNPMNPKITSKEPAKDEMGMDYIPVYEETESDANYYGCGMEGEEHVFLMKGAEGMDCPICGMPLKKLSKAEADKLKGVVSRVKIAGEQVALSGVATEPVRRLHLYKEIRTVGKVAYDPELAVAQEEFISALVARDKIQEGKIPEVIRRAERLVESSRRKLLLLGMSHEQIKEMETSREIQESLILPEEKMWIYGDVYEYEVGWVKVGGRVVVTTVSYPGEEFIGEITSVNPVFDPRTRSIRFRAEVENPDLKLKPEMYVDAVIQSMFTGPEGEHEVLAIPKNAVLDTGVRRIVWVDKGNGEYEGREIVIGPEATGIIDEKEAIFFPVIRGLSEGEPVVTKANFLIDSQSQLTGAAAAAYGGALGEEEKAPGEESRPKKSPVHQH